MVLLTVFRLVLFKTLNALRLQRALGKRQYNQIVKQLRQQYVENELRGAIASRIRPAAAKAR
ncbi:MAG TPA: hypothetical protein DE147_07715 [Gammaproteobacteria bacterium]|jgi:hypothetical protein|nr:hypothetical protein [Gammaproteobacteria bacterium]